MLRVVIKPVPGLFTLLFSWIAKAHFLFPPQIPDVPSPNLLEQDDLASSSLSELEEAEDSHISLRAVPAHTCSAFPPDPTGERSLLLSQPPPLPVHYTPLLLVYRQNAPAILLFHVSFLSPSSRLFVCGLSPTCCDFSRLKTKHKPLTPSPILIATHIFAALCDKAL